MGQGKREKKWERRIGKSWEEKIEEQEDKMATEEY